jgi:hypothetical protein
VYYQPGISKIVPASSVFARVVRLSDCGVVFGCLFGAGPNDRRAVREIREPNHAHSDYGKFQFVIPSWDSSMDGRDGDGDDNGSINSCIDYTRATRA